MVPERTGSLVEFILGLGEPDAAPGGEALVPESPPSVIILDDDEGPVALGEQPAAAPGRVAPQQDVAGPEPGRQGPGEMQWDSVEEVPSRPGSVTLRRSGPFGRTRVPARLTPALSRPREGASGGVYFLAPEDSAEAAEGYGSGWVVREGFPGREVAPMLERRRNYARELLGEGGAPSQEGAERWEGLVDAPSPASAPAASSPSWIPSGSSSPGPRPPSPQPEPARAAAAPAPVARPEATPPPAPATPSSSSSSEATPPAPRDREEGRPESLRNWAVGEGSGVRAPPRSLAPQPRGSRSRRAKGKAPLAPELSGAAGVFRGLAEALGGVPAGVGALGEGDGA